MHHCVPSLLGPERLHWWIAGHQLRVSSFCHYVQVLKSKWQNFCPFFEIHLPSTSSQGCCLTQWKRSKFHWKVRYQDFRRRPEPKRSLTCSPGRSQKPGQFGCPNEVRWSPKIGFQIPFLQKPKRKHFLETWSFQFRKPHLVSKPEMNAHLWSTHGFV